MFSNVRRHVIYQIASMPARTYPFTHLVVDDVFPTAFYAQMQSLMPDDDDYTPLVESGRVSPNYNPHRLAFFEREAKSNRLSAAQRAFWTDAFAALHHEDLGAWILAKFYDIIAERLGLDAPDAHMDLQTEIFLMRDLESYKLGPHTDSPSKVVSVLFYLPVNGSRPDLGTTLYTPKDPNFVCKGGPHYDAAAFDQITTIPYRPNTMLAFPKTTTCFHGVEPVAGAGSRRDIMLFDLKLPKITTH